MGVLFFLRLVAFWEKPQKNSCSLFSGAFLGRQRLHLELSGTVMGGASGQRKLQRSEPSLQTSVSPSQNPPPPPICFMVSPPASKADPDQGQMQI